MKLHHYHYETGWISKSAHSAKKIEGSLEGMPSRAKTRTDRWSNKKNMYGFVGKLKRESMINIQEVKQKRKIDNY